MAKLLTATAVAKLKPTSTRREIPDAGSPGLRLIVQPSGMKSWALRFRRPNGKSAKLTLGAVDLSGKEAAAELVIGQPLTLAAARALAADIGRQRARDLDVIAEHKTEKRRRRAALQERGAHTFGRAAQDFIEDHKVRRTGRKPRRWRETARLLGLDYSISERAPITIKHGLSDRWREKPIAEVDADDIYHVVEEARRQGIPGLERRNQGISDPRGRRMADALCTMFKWLHRHRRVEINPCIGAHRPSAPAARDRVLNVKADVRNADELRWFWAACDAVGQPFGILCKLLLLTGCRLNEAAKMTWDELSDDCAMLRLPGARTKNGRSHDVPLASLAREILHNIPRMLDSRFVFTTNGRTPISGFSKYKRRLDASMLSKASAEQGKNVSIQPWRLHDLRRTAATGMAGLGVAPHIVEAALNHVSGAKGGVAGTYNRETYEAEKRVAMAIWAEYISVTVSKLKSTQPSDRQNGG